MRRAARLGAGTFLVALGLAGISACQRSGEPETPRDPLPGLEQARVDSRWGPAECLRTPACDEVMVVAHRGDHRHVPENSLAAIRAAAELGAEFVEVDVRRTADGVLVLMHDDLEHVSDGEGAPEDSTWAELARLRLAGGKPADEETWRIPRFSDALRLARELSIMLYADLKVGSDESDEMEEWVLPVLAHIQAGDYHEQVLVRDNARIVSKMLALDDRLFVLSGVSDEDEFRDAMALAPELDVVEVKQRRPKPEFTAALRARGYTVQQDVFKEGDTPAIYGDYSGWKSFVDAGVRLLQTDRPDLLLPVVWRYRSTGEFPTAHPRYAHPLAANPVRPPDLDRPGPS